MVPPHVPAITPKRLRILGLLGVAGAPWMLIDFIENGLYDRFKNTSASGVHNLLFITGCMCSVAGLYLLRAAGTAKAGSIILIIQLLLLALANAWNVYEIVEPDSNAPLFLALAAVWPAACLFLIVTGLFIIKAKRLKGWRRFAPLLAGFWFPFMYLASLFFSNTLAGLLVAGSYAALTFAAMGFVLLTLPDGRFQSRAVK